jgi:hypothetical protein
MKHIRIILCSFVMFLSITMFCACSKSNDSNNNNNGSLAKLTGIWATPAWGGTTGDTLKLQISGTTAGTGKIISIASTTWNFSVGETILSNIVAGSSSVLFTGSGIYKHEAGNSVTSNSEIVITLSNNFTQMQVVYTATGISYYYVKQ